jgi:hypothetical protein
MPFHRCLVTPIHLYLWTPVFLLWSLPLPPTPWASLSIAQPSPLLETQISLVRTLSKEPNQLILSFFIYSIGIRCSSIYLSVYLSIYLIYLSQSYTPSLCLSQSEWSNKHAITVHITNKISPYKILCPLLLLSGYQLWVMFRNPFFLLLSQPFNNLWSPTLFLMLDFEETRFTRQI